MASVAVISLSSLCQLRVCKDSVKIRSSDGLQFGISDSFCVKKLTCKRFLHVSPLKEGLGRISMPSYAVGSGLEATIADMKENTVKLKNVKVIVESQDDDKIQLRVDVSGEETQQAFDKVLTSLARSAPPIPGFRRQKGGKTTQVPKSFLLQVLGEERVTKFVIQEIVSSSVADYVNKENLKVKENKLNTTQTADELKNIFRPGKDFGFNANLELENSESEAEISKDA